MKKKHFTVQNILLQFGNVSKRTTLQVMIGSLLIGAQAVAQIASPFDSCIETVSRYRSEMVMHERIPENYSEMITSLVEKSNENKVISNWNEALDSLALLEDDWDGENSAAVQAGAVQNCKNIIAATRTAATQLDEIYPTPFGSLCMEWLMPDGYVNAEVASNGMAFFRYYNDDKDNYTRKFQSISYEIIDDLKTHLS